ncbi:MAG: hypothetical protein AB1714_07630 [Acidobacteriota bacterium]
MAKPGKAALGKRVRERAKMEKRQKKAERRAQRKVEKENRPRGEGEQDPDLAGIVPGPQPPRDDF